MTVLRKLALLSTAIFFLWLTISIPNIPSLFTIDISNLSQSQKVLLQYSALGIYVSIMFAMAIEGDN